MVYSPSGSSRLFLILALVITQIGFCIAYFIFMGNTIEEMFPLMYKPGSLIPIKQLSWAGVNAGYSSTNAPVNSSTA